MTYRNEDDIANAALLGDVFPPESLKEVRKSPPAYFSSENVEKHDLEAHAPENWPNL